MSSTPSVATDLALKRTVHAPVEQKPHYAWRDILAGETIEVPAVILLCPHGEERFELAEVAEHIVAEAVRRARARRADQAGAEPGV